jgi:hypothetical protein
MSRRTPELSCKVRAVGYEDAARASHLPATVRIDYSAFNASAGSTVGVSDP